MRVGTGCTATAGSSTPAGGVELPTTSHKGGMRRTLTAEPGSAPDQTRLFKPAWRRRRTAAANRSLIRGALQPAQASIPRAE